MFKRNIVQFPSPNFSSPKGYKWIAIVDHIMSGTLAGTDSWFANPESKASSHFGVGKNGEIHQYVSLNNPAWANGAVNNSDWPLLIPKIDDSGYVNPNYYTVSIEHEGESGDVMPEEQYQATLDLHQWLIGLLGIPVDCDHIIGHYRIDSVNKSNCPGSGFPWDRLFKDLEGEDISMETAIVYWTLKDFSSAEQIAAGLGNCGMFCRNGVATLHPDAKKAKSLIVVGGPEVTYSMGVNEKSNITNLCGQTGPDTAILAANFVKKL